jgi:hypothetical protein
VTKKEPGKNVEWRKRNRENNVERRIKRRRETCGEEKNSNTDA